MKSHKRQSESDAGMQPEYDFTTGVRGKYAERYAAGSNVVVLAPDVAEVFTDSDSVNEALRVLANLVRERAAAPARGASPSRRPARHS
ncbi:MAG TPA: hypothetical protein VK066_31715 [Chloroflexota bacterium]|nr:hypothetical protein [Chloroflexota bacterium]